MRTDIYNVKSVRWMPTQASECLDGENRRERTLIVETDEIVFTLNVYGLRDDCLLTSLEKGVMSIKA
jgi:hypothetical protein